MYPNYGEYVSPRLTDYLLRDARPVPGVAGLEHVGAMGGLETPEALKFLVELYEACAPELARVLMQRKRDRAFVDERARHASVLGLEDANGRVVFGPLSPNYSRAGGKPIAPLPDYLKGPHVTLFGPPDSAKLAINAMNAYHRRLPGEPAVVGRLLASESASPMWGADDEDSKTPIHADLVDAAVNLSGCFRGDLRLEEGERSYVLANERLALPIKRFPGLALPSTFLFYQKAPIPLHLYDFALHLFHHRADPRALVFYVPKLENEEEARYIHHMIATAETMSRRIDPRYAPGSVRLMIVLENPRATLRVHEIIDALHPYFAGASLGWHDYLASTARLYKEDPNYRIPVKADPDIVIKHIQASHRLLADVVGSRGGVKVGGMYGILPLAGNPESMQITLRGFFRDVITQLKRDLTGFWVAHPDFVRIGLAIVAAWKRRASGDRGPLRELVTALLDPKHSAPVLALIDAPDVAGLDRDDPHYVRSLIVSDLKESDTIPNHHPDEIRYNVFQSLQYLADWLRGNGCVALPTVIDDVPVRVMDDLATAERSRWEVWAELKHGRFTIEDFIRIAHEEMNFIRRDLSDGKKIVQVKWDAQTARWYPIAFRLLLKLMTDANPVEFATELLLPFTAEPIRAAADPWAEVLKIDPAKYRLEKHVADYDHAFEICGNPRFAHASALQVVPDLTELRKIVMTFSRDEVILAASFHGDIGQAKGTLDARAASEQSGVAESAQTELRAQGEAYRARFGFKFLISAKGKSAPELLAELNRRLKGTETEELANAREALWEISRKRLGAPVLAERLEAIRQKAGVRGVSIAISYRGAVQNVALGEGITPRTYFQIASLSKPIAAAFAIDYFRARGIPLSTSVNSLFAQTQSPFRLGGAWGDQVRLEHLLSHSALNLHYVQGVPKETLLPQIRVIVEPGTRFQYSGGGFLVLEHLLEARAGKPIGDLLEEFFKLAPPADAPRADGYLDSGEKVPGGGLKFPLCAAGGWATAEGVAEFLNDLTAAYASHGSRISHEAAVEMLHGSDRGCLEFMGCRMGLGIFTAEAGRNRLAIHQGANEGFRAICVHGYAGPDRGKGIVILANGDNRAVAMIAEMVRELLEALDFEGMDFARMRKAFSFEGIPQEQIVNQGYKQLLFDAFEPDLPPPITTFGPRGPLDPLSPKNLAIGAKILSVTNQRFALAENLVSPHEPVFDPEAFCAQGKVMDSWETVRHNPLPCDSLVLELAKPARFRYVTFSTRFHDGNHPERAALHGFDGLEWREILAPMKLDGHAMQLVDLGGATANLTRIRVDIFPDGGLTRLGLYAEAPAGLALGSKRYPDAIPRTRKPLTLPFPPGGDRVLRASNEHYGPASQVVSPYPPIHMFDGFESARSRDPGHFEEVEIRLAKPTVIARVRLDFRYFVNNNPREVSIHGRRDHGRDAKTNGAGIELVARTPVKAYAGNFRDFEISEKTPISDLLVRTYPDGGINRIRVFGER